MLRTRDSIDRVTTTREGSSAPRRLFLATLASVGLLIASPVSHAQSSKTSFLAEQLRKNPDFRVRVDAALKLGTSDDPNGVKPLCTCLGDQSETEAVRIACAAALGKLKHPGGDVCLKANASDSSPKVKEQVGTSLKALGGSSPGGGSSGAIKCKETPGSGKAKYYVGVGISNKTTRPDTDIKPLVETQVICKLQAMGRFKMAPIEETDPKKMGAVVSKEKLDGYFLTVSVEPIKYEGGNVKVSMKLTMMTHTRDLKGELGKSLATTVDKSPSKVDEDDLIKMAAEKLVNDFAGLKP